MIKPINAFPVHLVTSEAQQEVQKNEQVGSLKDEKVQASGSKALAAQKRSSRNFLSFKQKKKIAVAIDVFVYGNGLIFSAMRAVKPVQEFAITFFTPIVFLPSFLSDFYDNSKSLAGACREKETSSAVDAGLKITAKSSDIVSSVGSMVKGLNLLKAIGYLKSPLLACSVTASTSLVGIGAVLSLGTCALHMKRCYTSFRLFKSLDITKIINDHNKGIATIKEQFHLDEEGAKDLKNKFHAIWKNSHPETLNKAKKALRKRLFVETLSQGLNATAKAISAIGTGIILLAPPFAPIGFGLLATAAAVNLLAVVSRFITERGFESTINTLALEAISPKPGTTEEMVPQLETSEGMDPKPGTTEVIVSTEKIDSLSDDDEPCTCQPKDDSLVHSRIGSVTDKGKPQSERQPFEALGGG